jgi:hypothetical protein
MTRLPPGDETKHIIGAVSVLHFIWLCGVSCGFNHMGLPKKKTMNRRRGDAEAWRSEEGKILAGKNEPFLLLPPRLRVSASPRLLFDFSRFDEPQRLRKDPHEMTQSHIIL